MSLQLATLKAELNPEQYRAVTTIDGPILIIAGAGSGKTRVITYRIAHMLDKGIPQSKILALTFTNKAAREMEERIKTLTHKKLQNLTISTFHAFGVRVLREAIGVLGYRENFSIYDETDCFSLIKESARELKLSKDAVDFFTVRTLFSHIKTGRKNWETANDLYRALYDMYQEGLKLYNAVDFDDLIMLPIKIFREHPEIRTRFKERYSYIMIDEFQDTSHQQYELMRLIAGNNVAVVGDDDQSIYSWRGADYHNIVQFEQDFPDVTEIRLEQNYRSTETILEAANGVISHNTNRKDKKLWSGNGGGKPIELFMPENETAEADFIAESIQGLALTDRHRYDEFGVLMRVNSQSRAIEEALLNANIPYTMSGGTSFFERKEIKDIISYLRVIANERDDVNLLRILNTPHRGIGRVTLKHITDWAKARSCPIIDALRAVRSEAVPAFSKAVQESIEEFLALLVEHRAQLFRGQGLSQKIRALVEAINYRDYILAEYAHNEKAARFKLKNIDTFIQSIDTWEHNPDNLDPSLFNYLHRITLLSRDDLDDETHTGKVNLMTIHAAKGLEFPVVFIAGAEEGILPHLRSVEDSGGNVEEERRLFYVAITRAQDKLLISSCRTRRRMQTVTECTPSRFLKEIPESLITYHEPPSDVSADAAHSFFSTMLSELQRP